MRLRHSLLALAVLPAGLVSTAALAAAPDFTGPHAELVVGLDQTDIGPGLPAREGLLYGLSVGHDWAAGLLRVGVEAEINASTAKDDVTGGEQSVGRSLYVGARLGLPLIDRFQIYAKGGYANGRFSGPVDYAGDGWRLGGGGEYALGDQLFLRAEYRYSDYGRRARGQQVVAAVGWRF